MIELLIAFIAGAGCIVVGFILGRSGVTVQVPPAPPVSTFHSEVLESFETWEPDVDTGEA